MFHVSKMVRCVPPFSELNVDKYLTAFEEVPESLFWLKQYLPSLLQSVLKGRVQITSVALSDFECTDYDVVKREIRKAYELVPEA